jgi:hypothetical protein
MIVINTRQVLLNRPCIKDKEVKNNITDNESAKMPPQKTRFKATMGVTTVDKKYPIEQSCECPGGKP